MRTSSAGTSELEYSNCDPRSCLELRVRACARGTLCRVGAAWRPPPRRAPAGCRSSSTFVGAPATASSPPFVWLLPPERTHTHRHRLLTITTPHVTATPPHRCAERADRALCSLVAQVPSTRRALRCKVSRSRRACPASQLTCSRTDASPALGRRVAAWRRGGVAVHVAVCEQAAEGMRSGG